MVTTRSQANRNNALKPERRSDNESEQSVHNVLSRTQLIEFDKGDPLNRNSDCENINIERREVIRHESSN